MVSSKRAIAAIIVCFKPHVVLTLCILLVIAHSIVIAIQRGASNSWRLGKHDITLTMTTLILIVALIWAAFFIFVVRFELRNELESLLVLFQCSKRGFRFLGVVIFHLGLLSLVALLVSAAVERSIPKDAELTLNQLGGGALKARQPRGSGHDDLEQYHLDLIRFFGNGRKTASVDDDDEEDNELVVDSSIETRSSTTNTEHYSKYRRFRIRRIQTNESLGGAIDRDYLLTVYKIWLTAIVYAFLYLTIENIVMFYVDMSLVEFVHSGFLHSVAKLTGVDLSDYPAGEMHFNPLVRRVFRVGG